MRACVLVVVAACGASTPPVPPPAHAAPPDAAAAATSVDAGDDTAVMAKRWAYARFFNQYKRAIGLAWNPTPVWSSLPASRVASLGLGTRTTGVKITMSPSGELVAVDVVQSSGVDELDREAVHAVRATGRIATPPAELVVNGVVAFAFSFYFEVDPNAGSTPPSALGVQRHP